VMAELARTYLIRSFALVGYSMGGNLVLKLAGELGTAGPSWPGPSRVCPHFQ
jgi:uncharacterized protein